MQMLDGSRLRGEAWRAVPDTEGTYEVSNLGRVRSTQTHGTWKPRVLSPIMRRDGYRSVCLYGATGPRIWLVHRLVLTVFAGARESHVHGAHRDGDKANNALTNLRWATCRENEADKVAHGRDSKGVRNGQAKLTEADIAAIRAAYVPRSRTACCRALAERYGLVQQTVWNIVSRQSWTHLQTNSTGEQ